MEGLFEKKFPEFPKDPKYEDLFFEFIILDDKLAGFLSGGDAGFSDDDARRMAAIVFEISEINDEVRDYCKLLINEASKKGIEIK